MADPRQTELAFALRRASARQLLRAVLDHGPELGVREAQQILRNPYVTTEVIDELAANRSLISSHEVRGAIARHPRTSLTVALRFVPGLFWRDLMELSLDVRIKPRVRRAAEKHLLLRLPQLALGERITLARRAGRAVLVELRGEREERVIAAMLDNPRLTEELLLPLAADPTARPQVLDRLAANARWRTRYRLRAALSRNPQTPFRVQRAILPGLKRRDLERVASADELSSVVRRWAEELLSPAADRAGGSERNACPPGI
ncbi:MAG: hypothetical protein D6696_21450 [Acidobacteria bacterium]|nr:MAG: hypothetical protein D6696_21450 [Acidobacteriota bacterium]